MGSLGRMGRVGRLGKALTDNYLYYPYYPYSPHSLYSPYSPEPLLTAHYSLVKVGLPKDVRQVTSTVASLSNNTRHSVELTPIAAILR